MGTTRIGLFRLFLQVSGLKEELVTRLYNLKLKEGGKRITELESIARKMGSYKCRHRYGRTMQLIHNKAGKTKAQRRTEEGV